MKSETLAPLPVTEEENPRTAQIASLDALGIVRLMNVEDACVAEAVEAVLPDIARAVDRIVEQLKAGGRLFYTGTGTSGRLGVLDASECPPTFGVPPELVQGIIAGGYDALWGATEASEDDRAAGGLDLERRGVTKGDAVVGLTASGRTPYTIAAVEHARKLGAFTAAVTCAPDSEITRAVEISVVARVGAETIAGSTRLKAGTAQKMILNMLSTATMIRLGYVTGNRMTNMQTRNVKLHQRAVRILMAENNLDIDGAEHALEAAAGDLRLALVMTKTKRSREDAARALEASDNVVEQAVNALA